jgi:UDP-3-O-[3-hydroxymyristoyl] glucosamine N-acyltransferase
MFRKFNGSGRISVWNARRCARVKPSVRGVGLHRADRMAMSRKIETVEDDAGKVTTYHRHPNGGGLIGRGADVDDTSFISATSYVEAGAWVGSGCSVGGGSWIDRKARIGHRAVIGEAVYVGPGAVVGNRAYIGSHSRIGAGAVIGHGVHLHGDTTVSQGSHIAAGARASARHSLRSLPDGSRKAPKAA